MAYWWVSQNQTFRHERTGGYLWAPEKDKSGATPFHWRTMLSIQPGDIIFSYVDQTVKAISVAVTSAYPAAQPQKLEHAQMWLKSGFRVDVEYEDVPSPPKIIDHWDELQPLLPQQYSPLNRLGGGNQGYLFHLPDAVGHALLNACEVTLEATVVAGDLAIAAIKRAPISRTEREALIKSRIGQGRFRKDLVEMWNGRCAITAVDLSSLLRASHIKPWSASNNAERLDPYNGLLLCPQYDAAFDAGLITFDDVGHLIASPLLSTFAASALGIHPGARLAKLFASHRPYLLHHRNHVFSGT